jgi:hypothetical protein
VAARARSKKTASPVELLQIYLPQDTRKPSAYRPRVALAPDAVIAAASFRAAALAGRPVYQPPERAPLLKEE